MVHARPYDIERVGEALPSDEVGSFEFMDSPDVPAGRGQVRIHILRTLKGDLLKITYIHMYNIPHI